MFEFQTDKVSGYVLAPRFTGKGYDLMSVSGESFIKIFMEKYHNRGILDMELLIEKDTAHICFTLHCYYPKEDPKTPYWFNQGNLNLALQNFHRDYPNIEDLT
jgi:hypothetical protein